MTDDMLQWGQVSPIGVGEGPEGELATELARYAELPSGLPDPRLKKPRHRPNNGRKRRFIGPLLTEPPWELLEGVRAAGYPIPPDLKCLAYVPSQWRASTKWRVWRDAVFAMWGDECHLCRHPKADSADHLVPLSAWGNQPYDPRISRPAHGVAGCPTCQVKCNSSRGNREFARQIGNYKPPVAL
jgi:hypothetical protein